MVLKSVAWLGMVPFMSTLPRKITFLSKLRSVLRLARSP
jgi:hypothetical protein